jgi:hypothetical protein
MPVDIREEICIKILGTELIKEKIVIVYYTEREVGCGNGISTHPNGSIRIVYDKTQNKNNYYYFVFRYLRHTTFEERIQDIEWFCF